MLFYLTLSMAILPIALILIREIKTTIQERK